jgi:hypothetical protein
MGGGSGRRWLVRHQGYGWVARSADWRIIEADHILAQLKKES